MTNERTTTHLANLEGRIEGSQVSAIPCAITLPTYNDSDSPSFLILPLHGYMVDPNMNLHIIFTVEKVTGFGSSAKVEPLASTDKIALINYGLMTMWRSIEMEINGKPLIPINTMAPYASLIRAYQELDKDSRESSLAPSGWDPDIPGLHEDFSISVRDNPSFTRRKAMIQDGKDVEFYGPVMVGPLRQEKPFADDVTIQLMFHRAPIDFFLLGDLGSSNASLRLTIKKATLYINRLKMRSGTNLGKEISYRYTDYETRHVAIKVGDLLLSENFLTGPCPSRVFAIMLSQRAYFGDLKRNPFYFPTNLLESLYIKKNNTIMIPAEPYTAELGTSASGTKYLYNTGRLFVETMKVLNSSRWLSHSSIGISARDFLFGSFIMGFGLSSLPGSTAPGEDVVLRFEAAFHEPLKESGILLFILEFEKALTVPTGQQRNQVRLS